MKKLFVDTNIVIDLLERREPFCNDAILLFTMAYNKKVKLFVSPMTFATASYLLRKHGTQGVNALLSNLRQLVHIAATDKKVIDNSIASSFPDFEDAMQYYTALSAKVDIIITRNIADFENSRLPIMTAEQFLSMSE